MISLDTHAFVWWRTGHRRMSRRAGQEIERAGRIFVPCIVLWEIAMLVDSGNLRLNETVTRWMADALDDPRIEVVPITAEIAVRAVDVGRLIRRDPADHLIAATAMVLGVPLVTRDAALTDLANLDVIW
jgi:PIN domain nuclease of toxin-antitoxin system